MKLLIKFLLLLIFAHFNIACQQINQSSITSPQTVFTPDNVDERDKIDEELKRAIENQDAGKIKELAEQVKEPVPLIKAIKNNDTEKVKELLERGANPNALDWLSFGLNPSYSTALWLAIIKENKQIIEQLLQHGADINEVSARYDSSLSKRSGITALR